MKKIRTAVVGIGHLGKSHVKIYDQLKEQVEIVAICDVKEDLGHEIAKQYNAPFIKDYKSLIGKIDAVNICVPTISHFELAEFFLKNNIHTFIEKPISTTVEQADVLIKTAEQHKKIIQVGHVERFNSAFQSIKHFTSNPLFIECHRLNRFPNRSLDIGVVMDLMIHDIDIVLGTVHSSIKDIKAVGVNVLTSLEDIASVRLEFENGCVCNLTASRVSDDVMRKIRIFQPDSYISLDYVKQEAFIYKRLENQILKHALPIEKEEPLKKELEHFIECVRENKVPIVSGQEGKQALKIALEISALIWKNSKR